MTLPSYYILYQPKLSIVGFEFQRSIERRNKIVFLKVANLFGCQMSNLPLSWCIYTTSKKFASFFFLVGVIDNIEKDKTKTCPYCNDKFNKIQDLRSHLIL